MASIIVTNGPKKGDYYPLGRRTTVVGRDEAVPIQIIDSHISRKHMQIHFNSDDETYSVIDMSSKHGVFVNGMPIEDETTLNDNDQITAGKTDLLFTLDNFEDRENALLHYKKVENPLIEIGLNCEGQIDVLVEPLDRGLYDSLVAAGQPVSDKHSSDQQDADSTSHH